ncbi:hypothetical protein [Ruminococcus sp. FC2018]|uniref:hypothetical protein n=1 Tax=Ruminococcus sp. FC2018 TaxID=1410617 RepID=UPI000AB548AB|nr:hypothetical protein [Ruminococcus sp. FC2018]
MAKGGGTVTISTRENDSAYEIIIADDGVGFDQARSRTTDTHISEWRTPDGTPLRFERSRFKELDAGAVNAYECEYMNQYYWADFLYNGF